MRLKCVKGHNYGLKMPVFNATIMFHVVETRVPLQLLLRNHMLRLYLLPSIHLKENDDLRVIKGLKQTHKTPAVLLKRNDIQATEKE